MNLKNLFNKKSKPSIESIQFNTFGWDLGDNTQSKKMWTSQKQAALLGIFFFDGKSSDLPNNLEDINSVRSHYRQKVVEQGNGGLIRCEVIRLHGLRVIELIAKQPNQPMGMNYISSLTIPFEKYIFMIILQAVERGITGMREAVILDKWMKENGAPKTDANGKMIGFSKDPYDENFTEGRVMNYSELELHDKEFPNHPLSIVRDKINALKKSITFAEELYQ